MLLSRTLRFAIVVYVVVIGGFAYAQRTDEPGILIQHAVIYDGSGGPAFAADVRVKGDRIAEVAPSLKARKGETVVDATGLAVAPGFIDMHSHAGSGVLKDPTADVVIRQGVTTILAGQDGESEFPLRDWFTKLEQNPVAINIASMSGQGTLREQVMGKGLLRACTPGELAKMKELLARDMEAGAFGLSTGLEYDPAHFSTLEELVELSKVASRYGGFYISHVRDEGNKVFDSFAELVEIGRQAKLPVEITHIKLGTTPVWHQAAKKMPEVFAQAMREGVDLRADVYPYTYWHSNIRVILLDRDYFNPEKVARAIEENGGAERIHVIHFEPDPSVNDHTLDEIAKMWKMSSVQAYMKIVKDTEPGPDGKEKQEDVIVESMSEDDVRWFIGDPRIAFCSDGGLTMQHPRSAGTFPRILGHYARDLKLLSMEEAIHKMTGLPAQELGLQDRGHIAKGYVADLAVFDPAKIIDRATIEHWNAPPDGIPDVMVSGRWVVRDGKVTGEKPGKVIRHQVVQ
ncbi:MAG: N-acyl-D-amino-acid deacylase family protein [Terriglobales bacterium]